MIADSKIRDGQMHDTGSAKLLLWCRKIRPLGSRILLAGLLLVAIQPLVAAEQKIGSFSGAELTTHPAWFKESFLDFEEDIAEAAAQGKRLVLYFYQDGCPYCSALVQHNFGQRDIVQATQDYFDLVTINMWGDREVVQVGGQSFTEKTLAQALGVQFTPTLFFSTRPVGSCCG